MPFRTINLKSSSFLGFHGKSQYYNLHPPFRSPPTGMDAEDSLRGENRRMQNLVMLNRVMLFVTLFGLVTDLI